MYLIQYIDFKKYFKFYKMNFSSVLVKLTETYNIFGKIFFQHILFIFYETFQFH